MQQHAQAPPSTFAKADITVQHTKAVPHLTRAQWAHVTHSEARLLPWLLPNPTRHHPTHHNSLVPQSLYEPVCSQPVPKLPPRITPPTTSSLCEPIGLAQTANAIGCRATSRSVEFAPHLSPNSPQPGTTLKAGSTLSSIWLATSRTRG